ncbi:T9SS type A sorting domain-containing protein [uncultured Flavobacterium sp.]|uniref:T9SS type A sorting domain-containing protein n=1 Tax=uncultured Flavobacterium sp. TaxID=165435 RepID=UPI0025CE306B|nr:T9SS type A sorting domain-containing protein [uncultured Flavobacterium sp.]
MKRKITLLAALMAFSVSNAGIIVRDIDDVTFTEGSSLDLDFNDDGTPEFSFEFQDFDNSIVSYFNPDDVNFVGTGTFDGGHGWDVAQFLTLDTTIDASSNFSAMGDIYVNGDIANADEMFPAGDSYVGVTFKIDGNKHYGWVLVHSTGGDAATLTIKSYAYNDVADEAILAGQEDTAAIDSFISTPSLSVYPNPVKSSFSIKSDSQEIISVEIFDVQGKSVFQVTNPSEVISVDFLKAGFYVSKINSANGVSVTKFIKQ